MSRKWIMITQNCKVLQTIAGKPAGKLIVKNLKV